MPDRSRSQALAALERGNAIRLEGGRIRREVRALGLVAGLRRVAELVDDPPEPIARMRVGHLLEAVRYVGEMRAHQLLQEAGILNGGAYHRRIGSTAMGPAIIEGSATGGSGGLGLTLTASQRCALVLALRRHATATASDGRRQP